MKVAVVGKGTASIITTLVLLKHDHEVVIYYDPNTNHLPVGESSTPHLSHLLWEVLGININDMVESNIVSLKTGVKFVDWGKSKYFLHNFTNQFAIHLENDRFNPYIHRILEENKLVKYIPQRVDNTTIHNDQIYIENEAYDFVTFCSGWDDNDEYIKPIFETVNSAVVYTKDCVDEDHNLHTIHKATENGWEFGLPFPKRKITKCGYLFDREQVDTKKVMEQLNSNIFFEWTPRYSKNILQNNFIAYNGNRLFFLEPLQALSFYYTELYARQICVFLNDRTREMFCSVNNSYLSEIRKYQLSLAYHYQYGSSYNTEFWNKITEKAKNLMSTINNGNKNIFLQNLVTDLSFRGKTKYSTIGSFESVDLKQLHCGMTQESLEDIINEVNPDLINN